MNKNLYTLSLDSIKYILGLIRDTVDLPTTILDDLHIQSTTTYSSYRLDTLLKALKEENIQYCDEAISKLNKLSKEIITDKLQITNENTIYLLLTDPVNNIYEQWLLINGTPQMIGTTEMKLDSVYTKDEADDRYALLTDFNTLTTSFNNLVTSVEKKIDKDKIVTVLDDTVTDEQILNALALKELLDEKNVENLFPIQYYNNTSDTRAGITATINNDRSVTFKGTATEQYFFVLWHKDNNGLGKAVALRGKTITITGGLASPVLSLAFYDEEGNNITPPDNAMKYDFGDGLTIKVPDNAYSVYSYYYCSANAVLDCTVYPMLEIGNVAHDYCPPNGTALTKGDIGDSINSDSTADEIVSAKLAFTNLIRGNSAIQSYLDEIGTNDVLQFPEGKHIISEKVTYTNLPEGVQGGYLEIWNMNGRSYETPFNSAWRYRVVKLQDFNTKKSYYRVLRAGETAVFLDTGWQRVCVTKVADVSFTELTVNNWAKGSVVYTVENGICYIWIAGIESSTMDKSSQTIVSNLPRPKRGGLWCNIASSDCTKGGLLVTVTPDGKLQNYSGLNNTTYFGSFSYPVAQ